MSENISTTILLFAKKREKIIKKMQYFLYEKNNKQNEYGASNAEAHAEIDGKIKLNRFFRRF